MPRRPGEGPWLSPPEYGATLGGFSVNLLVREIPRSVAFYADLLGFQELYSDAGFAAFEGFGLRLQLHADPTWHRMPWHPRLAAGEARGLGVELRLLGVDPDDLERRAREAGHAPLLPAADFPGHGWRECYLEDPDGYLWVAGRLLSSSPEGG